MQKTKVAQLRNAVDQINPSIEVEESFGEFPFSKILGEEAKLISKVNDTILQLNFSSTSHIWVLGNELNSDS